MQSKQNQYANKLRILKNNSTSSHHAHLIYHARITQSMERCTRDQFHYRLRNINVNDIGECSRTGLVQSLLAIPGQRWISYTAPTLFKQKSHLHC